MARLDGSHAVVTGAGRGLGRAIALALAAEGAELTLVARTADDIRSCAAEIEAGGGQASVHTADVSDEAAVEGLVAAAEERAPIDILVTAAGTNRPGPAADYAIADWDLLMSVNVRGTFLVCRAVGRHMLKRKRGRIITLSSQMGSVGYPERSAYCATKHAVNGLTRALAVEWAPAGITVNAVAPTFVDTPLTRPMFEAPAFAAEVKRRLPTGELATVDDVAEAALYLASAGRAVTGHILAVDGGWTAW